MDEGKVSLNGVVKAEHKGQKRVDEEEDVEDIDDEELINFSDDEKKRKPYDSPFLDFNNYLTYEEIDQFLMQASSVEELIGSRIMIFGGLRVAELVNLQLRDFNFSDGVVLVRRGKGDKDRWVPLDIATLSLVKAFATDLRYVPESQIFPYGKRTMQRRVEEMGIRSGIPKHISCHTLRHTCATWQVDKGIPLEAVRANLGHAHIEYTQMYLHLQVHQKVRMYRDATRFGL